MTSPDLLRRAQANVGRVLRAKWRLDSLLGVGGMASVYAATHRNGMRGAVKLLHPEFSFQGDVRDRFLREGYVANRIDHPGVVRVLDDDADEGSVFLVMELLGGMTVDAFAQTRTASIVELADAAAIGIQTLDVLAAAHAQGVVHRDIKPENLFITDGAKLKVLDFGIARLLDGSGSQHGTKTGSLMGTPAFMSPEQALGQWSRVDGRTDVYAVGATLFVLLTGRLVHEADSLNQLLLAAMTKPAPPIATVRPDLAPELAAVIDRALAFDLGARWPDAGAMQRALVLASGSGAWASISIGSGAGVGPLQPRVAAVPPASSGLPMSTTAAVSTGHGRPSFPRSRTASALVGFACALALGGLVLARFASSGRAPAAASVDLDATASPPPPVTPPPVTLGPTAAPTNAVDDKPTDPRSRSVVDAPPVEPSPEASGAVSAVAAPSASARAPKNTSPPTHRARCEPPYTVDVHGIKHAKPECL